MDSSTNWFLVLKIWALAVLKFLNVVLKFEPPNARVLYFPKNSALVLIRLVLINGDCVYINYDSKRLLSFAQTHGSILVSLQYFLTLLMSGNVSNVSTDSRRHKRHVWTGRFRNIAICIFSSKCCYAQKGRKTMKNSGLFTFFGVLENLWTI